MKIYSEAEIQAEYDVSVKEYSSGRIELKKYDRQIKYIPKGFEEIKDESVQLVSKIQSEHENSNLEIRSDSLSRSYSKMIDYALENASIFKSFWTLTFSENVIDLFAANFEFKKFIMRVKYRYPDFEYLGVPEFQKRGAVHYHLMTNVPIDCKEVVGAQIGTENKMYDVKQWTKGFTSVFDLSLADDHFSVAAYMTKYFFKDIDNRLFGRQKILHSIGLKVPGVVHFNSESQEFQEYIAFLERTRGAPKEKHIPSTKRYVPSLSIYTFDYNKEINTNQIEE